MLQNNNKSHKKLNQYLWLGVSLGVLLLIVLLIVIPNANRNHESSQPTNTTNQTEDTTKPTNTTGPEPDSTESTPTSESESTHEEPSTSDPTTTPTTTTPSTTPPQQSNVCLHEEAGRCWDDLEDEAYSAGAYDHEYGYYGASLDYADDCDALCRDILEDAYDEGWSDARY